VPPAGAPAPRVERESQVSLRPRPSRQPAIPQPVPSPATTASFGSDAIAPPGRAEPAFDSLDPDAPEGEPALSPPHPIDDDDVPALAAALAAGGSAPARRPHPSTGARSTGGWASTGPRGKPL